MPRGWQFCSGREESLHGARRGIQLMEARDKLQEERICVYMCITVYIYIYIYILEVKGSAFRGSAHCQRPVMVSII